MYREAVTAQDTVQRRHLYCAFELSKETWKLAFSIGGRRPARVVSVPGRDLGAVVKEVDRAKRRFTLTGDVVVHSCYEAGRDGFWVHRALSDLGFDSIVVDAASIGVNRRARRTKTDRLDAEKLVGQLVRYHAGEKRVWSVLRIPSVEDEDIRHLHRELRQLRRERREHRMRIQSLLFTHGVDLTVRRDFLACLEKAHQWDGRELPGFLRTRLIREYRRLTVVAEEIGEIRRERRKLLETSRSRRIEKARLLAQLRGSASTPRGCS